MKVKHGVSSGNHCIFCEDGKYTKYVIFDKLGRVLKNNKMLLSRFNFEDVDFISFVSNDSRYCDVLINGSRYSTSKPLNVCSQVVKSKQGFIREFLVKHRGSRGSFNQVICIFYKGCIRVDNLKDELLLKVI